MILQRKWSTCLITLFLINTAWAEYPIGTFMEACGSDSQQVNGDSRQVRCLPLINGVADGLQYLMAERGMNPLICLPDEYPDQDQILMERITGPLQEIASATPERGVYNAITVTLIDQYWCEGNQKPKPSAYSHTAVGILPQCVSKSEADRMQCGFYAVATHNILEGLSGAQGNEHFYCPSRHYDSMKSVLAMTLDYLADHPEQQHLPLPTVMARAMVDRSPCS